MTEPPSARPGPPSGLCGSCCHARVIVSAKGSSFTMCQRAAADPRYRKYPPLPVVRCEGHEAVAASGGQS